MTTDPSAPGADADRSNPGDSARRRRAELLSAAEAAPLQALAERCLADGTQPEPMLGPDVGMVTLQVREPVEATRFLLGDVLATRCELRFRGARGWSMRLGDDRPTALAAAICDAEAEAGGPLRAEIEALCHRTEQEQAEARRREWEALAPTVVSFEEMG